MSCRCIHVRYYTKKMKFHGLGRYLEWRRYTVSRRWWTRLLDAGLPLRRPLIPVTPARAQTLIPIFPNRPDRSMTHGIRTELGATSTCPPVNNSRADHDAIGRADAISSRPPLFQRVRRQAEPRPARRQSRARMRSLRPLRPLRTRCPPNTARGEKTANIAMVAAESAPRSTTRSSIRHHNFSAVTS